MYYPVHTFAGITTAIQEEGKPLVVVQEQIFKLNLLFYQKNLWNIHDFKRKRFFHLYLHWKSRVLCKSEVTIKLKYPVTVYTKFLHIGFHHKSFLCSHIQEVNNMGEHKGNIGITYRSDLWDFMWNKISIF